MDGGWVSPDWLLIHCDCQVSNIRCHICMKSAGLKGGVKGADPGAPAPGGNPKGKPPKGNPANEDAPKGIAPGLGGVNPPKPAAACDQASVDLRIMSCHASKKAVALFWLVPLSAVVISGRSRSGGYVEDWCVQLDRAETHSSILGQRVWWACRPEKTEMCPPGSSTNSLSSLETTSIRLRAAGAGTM